MYYSTAKL